MGRRSQLGGGLMGLLVAVALPAAAQAASSASYWQFAARQAQVVDARWSDAAGAYLSYHGPVDTRLNSAMLHIHALAAGAGQNGVVRQDARARRIVDLLTRPPAFVTSRNDFTGSNQGVAHYPGWTGNASGSARGEMHMSIDPKVAEALAAAWTARAALGLTASQATKIQSCISRVAKSSLFAYPSPTLNQWNWPADLWASYGQVTGDWDRATSEYRSQIVRFLSGFDRPQAGMKSPNVNDGLGFMYGPELPAGQWPNMSSSTEYGNIVYSAMDEYESMLSRGMTPLSSAQQEQLRNWSQRNLQGEWTHSGYTNWDTGIGMLRWQLMRYWAWSTGGLLAHTAQSSLAFDPAERAWSTWILDRTLALYERWAAQNNGVLPGYQWDIPGTFSITPDDDGLLNAARFAVLASSAATRNLDGVVPQMPPSWFAFDADVRRLAISTPNYHTALLRPQPGSGSRYGGMEPVRLYDSQGRPLSGVGGTRSNAFGIALLRAGQAVLNTQPSGVLGYTSSGWTLSGDGAGRLRGSFTDLSASARIAAGSDSVELRHRFTPTQIITTRTIKVRSAAQVQLFLPVWGVAASATLGIQPLTANAVPLPADSIVTLSSSEGGSYTATLAGLPSGASVRLQTVDPQDSSPRTRRSVVVSFSLPANGQAQVVQTLTPANAG